MVERQTQELIARIRKGKEPNPQLLYCTDVFPALLSDGCPALWDHIIYRWYSLLRNSRLSMKNALDIRHRMKADDWSLDNNDYVAMCKWIETGIDGIKQWNFESDNIVEDILSGLKWENVRKLRNALSHSFMESSVAAVKRATDEWLPEFIFILSNLSLCPAPRIPAKNRFVLPEFKIESMKRVGVLPLDIQCKKNEIEAGAKISYRCAFFYVHYDKMYRHYIFYTGYDHFGRHWTVAPAWGKLPRTVEVHARSTPKRPSYPTASLLHLPPSPESPGWCRGPGRSCSA